MYNYHYKDVDLASYFLKEAWRLRVVKHNTTLMSLCPNLGNGQCDCGICKCNDGYEGSACQCQTSLKECQTSNNTVCYGRGRCKCSRCECDEGYQRPHCKTCLGCPDPCQTKLWGSFSNNYPINLYKWRKCKLILRLIDLFLIFLRSCIECLGFNSGPFKGNCSKACSSIVPNKVSWINTGGKQCEQKDSEGCWIKFSLEQLDGVDTYSAVIKNNRGNTEQIVTSHGQDS